MDGWGKRIYIGGVVYFPVPKGLSLGAIRVQVLIKTRALEQNVWGVKVVRGGGGGIILDGIL